MRSFFGFPKWLTLPIKCPVKGTSEDRRSQKLEYEKWELGSERLKQPMNEERSLKKAMALARAPGMHQERMDALLARIKQRLPELEELLVETEDHSGEEDGVYRFLSPVV